MRKRTRKAITAIILAALLLGSMLLAANTTIFEDGSFGVGRYPYPVHGCLVNSECDQPDITLFGLYIPFSQPVGY